MSASPSPEPSVQPNGSSRPLLILLIAICTLMIVTYAGRLGERDRIEADIAAQQIRNEEAKVRTAALQEELDKVTQPSYVDEIARTALGMGQEGDVIIVAVAPDTESPAQPMAPSQDEQAPWQPIWRQWLKLFTPNS